MNIDDLLKDLRRRAARSSQKALAAELDIGQSYLCDVLRGRRHPGPSLLRALGLRRTVRYERER
jgi:transcriptional regulator with XRE-family HTH domain